jgi:aminopeptidase
MDKLTLEEMIVNYARLAVTKGVAVRPGQELVVTGSVEQAKFVREVVKAGYEEGAGHVTVIWADDAVARLEYENMPVKYFEETPNWKREQLNSLAASDAAFLFVEGGDPEALTGIDPMKLATAARARNEQCKTFREGLDFGRNAWSIIGVPVEPWARKVFPSLPTDEAVERLWRAILSAARSDGPDPNSAWDAHSASFEFRKRKLNSYKFDQLHYVSKNGTDFTLGLTVGHLWEGGCAVTTSGTTFLPNIPTEEVFTSPNRLRADGIVHSALPLVHAGNIVDDFWLRFEDGRVVDYGAAVGVEVLKSIVETDENSCRLGECALISKDTPIRESGLLFYDTLYDENASCHLALGTGFPECIQGGLDMNKDELIKRGVNQSHTHVDFMIGSDDLSVTGITEAGVEVKVFENGLWATEFAKDC